MYLALWSAQPHCERVNQFWVCLCVMPDGYQTDLWISNWSWCISHSAFFRSLMISSSWVSLGSVVPQRPWTRPSFATTLAVEDPTTWRSISTSISEPNMGRLHLADVLTRPISNLRRMLPKIGSYIAWVVFHMNKQASESTLWLTCRIEALTSTDSSSNKINI